LLSPKSLIPAKFANICARWLISLTD
jgi:hypothetical protein